ncbi:hypothetical protein V4U86_22905 [Mycobacterium sp. AMU20-3851]|uniref:hypothetical protein n=1 Tax=Mycobacterium sp. AMU20-3851 TaxID=3122055 RepID=UPI003754EC1D
MLRWYYGLNPVVRLLVRWAFIAVLTLVAFWETLDNLVQTTLAGGLVSYVWIVPPAAALAALGVNFRRRNELPIHDRQTDIIVGLIGMGLALMVQGVLLARYAEFFHLMRLDLLAMWLFAFSCGVVLFGVRPIMRFVWVWVMLSLVFPLPYQILVIVLGGGKVAAAIGTIVIAAAASAIAVGRTPRRALIGAVGSLLIGLVILLAMYLFAENSSLLAYQAIPALGSILVVGLSGFLYVRRGKPKQIWNRKVEPLAAKQIWSAVPLVIVVATALAFMPLPVQLSKTTISRAAPFDLEPDRELATPTGWSLSTATTYSEVSRYYGDDAVLVRQRFVADAGDPRFDKLSAPRTLTVDSIVSDLPFSFDAYPGQVLYDTTGTRLSAPREVDLGHGVTGEIISAIDDRLLVTWNVLRFAWGDDDKDQIVDVFAVDNHLPNAPFPSPERGLISTLRNLLTVLFRGNAVVVQEHPKFKDAELLTEFGRDLVAAQFEPTGAKK